MKDFGYTFINGYADIDLLNETTTREAIIYNAIFEESRIVISPETQPIEQRGGSVKDTIYNTTTTSYGTLIWFDKNIANGRDAVKNITTRVGKKLTTLIESGEINAFENLNITLNNRELTIKFNYNYNNNKETFSLKQYV